MIDSSEKRNRQLAFELQNSHVCEKRSNNNCFYMLAFQTNIYMFSCEKIVEKSIEMMKEIYVYFQ